MFGMSTRDDRLIPWLVFVKNFLLSSTGTPGHPRSRLLHPLDSSLGHSGSSSSSVGSSVRFFSSFAKFPSLAKSVTNKT